MKGRAHYPSTTLLFNIHVGFFPGFVVLHHLRLQEERDEGDAGRELYISYLLEGGEGQELYIYCIFLKVVRGKSKRLYSMARQLSRAMSSEYISLVVIIGEHAQ